MKIKHLAIGFAASLLALPAFAMPPNHTVKFVVPVDISNMPYVNALTVGCELTYPQDAVLTPDQSGQAHDRADINFSGGEFHSNVEITITAPNGPAPTGYKCELYVTPTDGTGAFQPVSPSYTSEGIPPEHYAAQGTVPVTQITGTFGPLQIQSPQIRPLQRQIQPFKPPPGN